MVILHNLRHEQPSEIEIYNGAAGRGQSVLLLGEGHTPLLSRAQVLRVLPGTSNCHLAAPSLERVERTSVLSTNRPTCQLLLCGMA
jgi:hypothetical protein